MKTVLAMLLFAGVVQNAPAFAQSTTASPLLGSWAVDVSRLPIPPEARPKSVTITFGDAGSGRVRANVDIAGGDGSQRHMVATYTPDGSATPIQGDTAEADTAAIKIPISNVLVLGLAKGGIPASTRVYTVAPDGNTMIETASSTGSDGKPVIRTNYFTRIR